MPSRRFQWVTSHTDITTLAAGTQMGVAIDTDLNQKAGSTLTRCIMSLSVGPAAASLRTTMVWATIVVPVREIEHSALPDLTAPDQANYCMFGSASQLLFSTSSGPSSEHFREDSRTQRLYRSPADRLMFLLANFSGGSSINGFASFRLLYRLP